MTFAPRPVPLPPPVRPGSRVGVAALSSPVDGELLAAGLVELARLGFEPVLAGNLESRDRIFAGTDGERLAAFHELVDDESLEAIFFARGGHGILRLLDGFDWEKIRRRPRAYIGYSDLTPFLAQLVQRCGWCGFHGPMVASDLSRGLDGEEERSLLGALGGEFPMSIALDVVEAESDVEGVLLGGCLTLLAATLGTDHRSEIAGSMLFLEDIDEPLYRLDRMLTHLKLSGSLAGIRAMIFGTSIAPDAGGQWLDLARDAAPGVPLAFGLSSGHIRPNLTLPLGAACRLDVQNRRLVVEGS